MWDSKKDGTYSVFLIIVISYHERLGTKYNVLNIIYIERETDSKISISRKDIIFVANTRRCR